MNSAIDRYQLSRGNETEELILEVDCNQYFSKRMRNIVSDSEGSMSHANVLHGRNISQCNFSCASRFPNSIFNPNVSIRI